jgi:hypothetical protein
MDLRQLLKRFWGGPERRVNLAERKTWELAAQDQPRRRVNVRLEGMRLSSTI